MNSHQRRVRRRRLAREAKQAEELRWLFKKLMEPSEGEKQRLLAFVNWSPFGNWLRSQGIEPRFETR